MILLIGKTSVGKTSIANEIVTRGYEQVVTTTTRPMRNGEVKDKTYHYITKEEFLEKEKNGYFTETSSYMTKSGIWYYGSSIEDYEKNKIMVCNPDGVVAIKKLKEFNPVVFYIVTDEEIIKERLIKRGDNPEEARRRLEADNYDFRDIDKHFDYAIRNDGNLSLSQIADMILYLYQKGGHINGN